MSVELALAHVNSDADARGLSRDELLCRSHAAMREWANFCGALPRKGRVVRSTDAFTRAVMRKQRVNVQIRAST